MMRQADFFAAGGSRDKRFAVFGEQIRIADGPLRIEICRFAEPLEEHCARQSFIAFHEEFEKLVLILGPFRNRENFSEIGIGVRFVVAELGIRHRLHEEAGRSIGE